MTEHLRDQLQSSLGVAYIIQRELGGGGMSRVFVAQETALGRAVVIKVIAPELAEGVSAERFTREVKLAARLQQAKIVPVLNTGSSDSLPYARRATTRCAVTRAPTRSWRVSNVERGIVMSAPLDRLTAALAGHYRRGRTTAAP